MPRRGSKRSGTDEGAGEGEESTESTTTTTQPSPRKQSPSRSKKAKGGGGEGEEKGTTTSTTEGESSSSSSSSAAAMETEQTKQETSTPASSMGAERSVPTEKCNVCGAMEPRGFAVPDYIKRYEENAKSQGLDYKVIEEGRLIFLYRPKVNLHHVEKVDDIQRFYIAMEAMRTPLGDDARRVANAVYHHNMHVKSKDQEQGVHESSLQQHKHIISTITDDKGRAKELDSIEPILFRVMTIPAKHLPKKKEEHGKFATVLSVSTDRNMIHEEMKERYYGTATRGTQFQDKARIVAEAFYMMVRETHNNRRLSKLVYAVESPKEITEPMKVFNIHMEGSFIMNVFNPERRLEGRDRSAQRYEMAAYPPYLQQLFEGLKKNKLKSIPVDPPSFLNYQHTSLLLFDASDRLHKDLHPLLELVEKEEQLDIEAYGENDLTEKPLKELNTTMEEMPVVGKKLE